MKKTALFLIDGFEEAEAVTIIDILRRGEVSVELISLTDSLEVMSKRGVKITADQYFEDAKRHDYDMLIIPGGTLAYLEHQGLLSLVKEYDRHKKLLAAICAAPTVFGKLGLLEGKKATTYPGMYDYLRGAEVVDEIVVTSGNITTSKGPATAPFFALELVRILAGEKTAAHVSSDFLVDFVKKKLAH